MNAFTQIPPLQDVRKYSVNRAGIEGIKQSLYDFQLYPTAGAAQLNFFQQQIGQGIATALGAAVGSAKTKADTNMTLSGQLAAGQSHLVLSIEVPFFAGLSAVANNYTPAVPVSFAVAAAATVGGQVNDINSFYQSGSLQLYIGQKTYLEEAPLGRFPPKAGFNLEAALSTNSATVGEVAAVNMKAGGRPYMLNPPVLLESSQNFVVSMNFPAVVATPSGFNGRVGVILDGYLYRNSQ